MGFGSGPKGRLTILLVAFAVAIGAGGGAAFEITIAADSSGLKIPPGCTSAGVPTENANAGTTANTTPTRSSHASITEVPPFPLVASYQAADAPSSFVIDPKHLGDLIIVLVINDSKTSPDGLVAIGINGGRTWTRVLSYAKDAYTIWMGTVTRPGTQPVAIKWPSSVIGDSVSILEDELTARAPARWSALQSAGTDGDNGSALDYPSIESGSPAQESYWGALDPDLATPPFAGHTLGFVFHQIESGPSAFQVVFSGALATCSTYTPEGSAATGGYTFELGMTIAATMTGGKQRLTK